MLVRFSNSRTYICSMEELEPHSWQAMPWQLQGNAPSTVPNCLSPLVISQRPVDSTRPLSPRNTSTEIQLDSKRALTWYSAHSIYWAANEDSWSNDSPCPFLKPKELAFLSYQYSHATKWLWHWQLADTLFCISLGFIHIKRPGVWSKVTLILRKLQTTYL